MSAGASSGSASSVRPHPRPAWLPSAPFARVLGEALALTILLGSSLKIDGRFQLQTRSDGAIGMIVVDFDAPDRLRAFARFDAARLAEAAKGQDLLGRGHLAFTIDQGGDAAHYQGIVALDGQGLEAAATNISVNPSRFRRGFGSPSRKA